MILTCLLSGCVDFDHLVEVASASFRHSKDAGFPFPHAIVRSESLSPGSPGESSSTSQRERHEWCFYVAVGKSVFTSEVAHRSAILVSVWLIETLRAFKPCIIHIFDFFIMGNTPRRVMPLLFAP